MVDQKTIDRVSATSARTDTETGNEHLSPEEDRKREIKVIKGMYENGNISEEDYNRRMNDLKAKE